MITIKDMAEAAGVSPTTVANVLHSRTNKMSKETLKKRLCHNRHQYGKTYKQGTTM